MNLTDPTKEVAPAPSVLFVDQAGELGGAELSLFDIVRLRRGQSRVVLLSDGPFATKLASIGVSCSVLPLGSAGQVGRSAGLGAVLRAGMGLFGVVLRLAKQIRAADLVYANTQKAFVLSAIAATLARRPLVWHLRDMITAEHFSGSMRKITVTLANRVAKCVIANSKATADAFVAAGGKAPLYVVYNGIDPAPFDAIGDDDARSSLRAEIGVPNAPLVGVFSRLAEWKGQHILVEALKKLPSAHAVFVGGALFGERGYEDALHQEAEASGLSERCHFLGFRSDVPALMKGVDIIAHTSVSPEPFGRVIVEGMLAGRPVVASNAGGPREIIRNGDTGVLVEPGSSQELALALEALIASSEDSTRLAASGKQSARENYSLSACSSGVEKVLRDSLEGRS